MNAIKNLKNTHKYEYHLTYYTILINNLAVIQDFFYIV